ncbi:Uncharacterised protein [Yersinia intermedia]|uniref:Uncharacterized protein n=1 Tax=Yersinia intermedia TaxID=631 RepID=A0A0H5LWX8_YERIN|nr:Uncharacterised protein [Yersinia intermedia]
MTKYTEAALIVVKRCQANDSLNVMVTWQSVIRELKAYDEACPRSAFIGLCEEGLVKGIPAGSYGLRENNKNKGYAVAAANLILSGHELDHKVIWRKVTDSNIVPHDQVNIVIALHNAQFLQSREKT